MIRLIASDMDGTLLDSRKNMPPRFEDAVRALAARGVRFAVASGRQYECLLRDFEQVRDDILFIAENGALVMDRGRRLLVDPVPAGQLPDVIATVRAMPGAYPILCTAEGAFIEDREPVFMQNALMYYARCEIVPDLLALCAREDVCQDRRVRPLGAELAAIRRCAPPSGAFGHPLRRNVVGHHAPRREQGHRHARHSKEPSHLPRGMHGVRGLFERPGAHANLRAQLRHGERPSAAEGGGAL